jgi:hypothetical protein
MPTLRALRESGAHTLELAVTQHGGPGAVAASLGLRPRCGNHATWEALLADMQQVMAVAGTPAGIMPSRRAFIAAGRGDLYRCEWRNAKHARRCCALYAELRCCVCAARLSSTAAWRRLRAAQAWCTARRAPSHSHADMRMLRRHKADTLLRVCFCCIGPAWSALPGPLHGIAGGRARAAERASRRVRVRTGHGAQLQAAAGGWCVDMKA